MSRSIKIVLTVVLVAGGVGYLMASSLEGEVAYYKHVEEVMAAPAKWVDKPLQVHGFVEAGSIDKRIEGHQQTTRFVLESKGARIAVTTTAPIPDTFKDAAEVVAKGRLDRAEDGSYRLVADELSAKCPSKYEENRRKSLAGS
ncbi:MAG: cytochrome c maturation protein CcmE [Deltaproteobacteria bacterium]|nr:MAG: cytochrome c maturation protein CcmE [Deltaproteobacteria bacterium]